MPRCSRVRPSSLPILVLLLVFLSCTVKDPQVGAIGAVSLLAVNPALVSQSVTLAPGGTIAGNRTQTTLWNITTADLTLDDTTHDLLFAGNEAPDCRAIDTPTRLTINFGDCVESLVLESFDENAGVQATLKLVFSVRLKRVVPVVYPLIGDADLDGILNGNDNCILVANPNQEDAGNLGIGDACRVSDFFSGVQLDSDGDGVPDSVDNCVHRANPEQANPPTWDSTAVAKSYTELEAAVSDGLGLACEDNSMNPTPYKQQIIDIGNVVPIEKEITFDFVLPSTQGFLLVDFNDEIVFPNCEWELGTCSGFDADAIRVCIRTSTFEALEGCV
jgi:hypothetical protein